jgi:hypothetical protein
MTLIINPGSGPVAESGSGWTNTEGQARVEAERWLAMMREDGITHIELSPTVDPGYEPGQWAFSFRHTVTGVIVRLVTHGIDDTEAYRRDGHIFEPRVYWNESSTGNPEVEQWAAPGFEVIKTFRRSS